MFCPLGKLQRLQRRPFVCVFESVCISPYNTCDFSIFLQCNSCTAGHSMLHCCSTSYMQFLCRNGFWLFYIECPISPAKYQGKMEMQNVDGKIRAPLVLSAKPPKVYCFRRFLHYRSFMFCGRALVPLQPLIPLVETSTALPRTGTEPLRSSGRSHTSTGCQRSHFAGRSRWPRSAASRSQDHTIRTRRSG